LPHAQIESWEQLLLTYGPFLQKKRIELTQKLREYLQSFYATLGSEPINLRYKPSVEPEASAWKKAWEKLRNREIALKRTLIGPHSEDFVIELNHKQARGYASEGQKKSLLIALKWAEAAYLSGLQAKGPILLLDDIGEKLDAFRLRAVGQLARLAGQTFLTDVDPLRVEKAFPELPIYEIQNP
jgi:DNA replication and repair protein RecF